MEYADRNIRINAVALGSVMTEMLEEEIRLWGGAQSEQQKAKFAAMQPVGRIVSSQEVAKVVLFIASEDASFITGASVYIDGGFSVQ